MTKITNDVLNQKLDDLINVVNEVKDHAKFTNGKISEAMLKIQTVETLQSTCPARLDKEKGTTREWVKWVIMAFIGIGSALVTNLSFVIGTR